MAWIEHYIVPFRSKNGTDYAVKIYEQDYAGSVVALTPSDQPFTTQEDDDDDVFTPVRSQSGYLRVIDMDGSLMEQLIPANNTEKMVRLWQGTYSNGVFIEGFIQWQGFLQAQAYTQPWLDNPNEIEMPVKSMLGVMEDVALASDYAFAYKSIAYLLYTTFHDLIGVEPEQVMVMSDLRLPQAHLFCIDFSLSIFFSKKEVINEGQEEVIHVGDSMLSVWTEIMKFYGLTLREDGADIYIAQYDGKVGEYQQYTWEQIAYIAETGSTVAINRQTRETKDLMESLDFRADDTEKTYVNGARTVEVSLDIETNIPPLIEQPATEEDSTPPIYVATVTDDLGTLGQPIVIQPHRPVDSETEHFHFNEYTETFIREYETGYPVIRYERVASSNYDALWSNLMLRQLVTDQHGVERNRVSHAWPSVIEGQVTNPFYTGAFPVRWVQEQEDTTPTLRSGILLVQGSAQISAGRGSVLTNSAMYSIKSSFAITVEKGWLNVDVDIYAMNNRRGAGDYNVFNPSDQSYSFECVLRIGNKYWNGTEWIDNYHEFTLPFKGNTIDTNRGDYPDIDVEKSDGYFIPIAERMTGDIELTINDGAQIAQAGQIEANVNQKVHKVMTDLKIENLLPKDIVSSSRSNNIYHRTVLSKGFSEEKTVGTVIGTNNNNIISPSFILLADGSYIEQFSYGTSESHVQERPEVNLLGRLAVQSALVRSIYEATIANGNDYMHTLYRKDGKIYFGVKSQADWRDDAETIKFIEINHNQEQ